MEVASVTSSPSPAVDIEGFTGTQEKGSALNMYVCTYMPIELRSEQKSCWEVAAACEWMSGSNTRICATAKSGVALLICKKKPVFYMKKPF